jgi:hypothetical protein
MTAVSAVARRHAKTVERLARIALAGGKGADRAMFLLERDFPEFYGPHQKIELTFEHPTLSNKELS